MIDDDVIPIDEPHKPDESASASAAKPHREEQAVVIRIVRPPSVQDDDRPEFPVAKVVTGFAIAAGAIASIAVIYFAIGVCWVPILALMGITAFLKSARGIA